MERTRDPRRILIRALLLAGIAGDGRDALAAAGPADDPPEVSATVVEVKAPPPQGGADAVRDQGPAEAAPPLGDLVAEALRRSPTVAALEARLLAALEMVRPAGALPDPMVEGMLVDAGFPRITVGREEMSMVGLEVRQGLLWPGKRKARRAAAQAEAAVRGTELAQLQRALVAEVRTIYARLYALDREGEALASARELLDMLSAAAASRYSAGQGELEAVAKAKISLSRLGQRVDDLVAGRAVLVARLNRLLDRPGEEPLGLVRMLPAVEPPTEPWEEAALARSADVAVARAAVEAAERRLRVARSELNPNLAALTGFGSRGDLDPVVTLRLGLEVPFWKGQKQKPLVRAAELEVRASAEELRAAEAAAGAEAARLRSEWHRVETQVRRFDQAIVPQSSVVLDAARASYQAGRGDFSTVIEDFNLWLDARVELYRLEADRLSAWAELMALAGPSPAEGVAP